MCDYIWLLRYWTLVVNMVGLRTEVNASAQTVSKVSVPETPVGKGYPSEGLEKVLDKTTAHYNQSCISPSIHFCCNFIVAEV